MGPTFYDFDPENSFSTINFDPTQQNTMPDFVPTNSSTPWTCAPWQVNQHQQIPYTSFYQPQPPMPQNPPSLQHSTFGLSRPDDLSYAGVIYRGLLEAPGHMLSLKLIYDYVLLHCPQAQKREKQGSQGWQNSVRHNLSLNNVSIASLRSAYLSDHSLQAFANVELDDGIRGLWTLTPEALSHGIYTTTAYRNKKAYSRYDRPGWPMMTVAEKSALRPTRRYTANKHQYAGRHVWRPLPRTSVSPRTMQASPVSVYQGNSQHVPDVMYSGQECEQPYHTSNDVPSWNPRFTPAMTHLTPDSTPVEQHMRTDSGISMSHEAPLDMNMDMGSDLLEYW